VSDLFYAAVNQGVEVYFSPDPDKNPTAEQMLGRVQNITGGGASVELVDTTSVTDKTSYKKHSPLLAEHEEFVLTLFTDSDNFKVIREKYLKGGPNSWKGRLGFKFPRVAETAQVQDIVYVGVISGFTPFNEISTTTVRQFTLRFKPAGDPMVFPDFGEVTNLAASPKTFTHTGGQTTVTITGTGLRDGILVWLTDAVDNIPIEGEGVWGLTKGTATSQTVTLNVPPNPGVSSITYDVVAYNNGDLSVPYEKTDSITVNQESS